MSDNPIKNKFLIGFLFLLILLFIFVFLLNKNNTSNENINVKDKTSTVSVDIESNIGKIFINHCGDNKNISIIRIADQTIGDITSDWSVIDKKCEYIDEYNCVFIDVAHGKYYIGNDDHGNYIFHSGIATYDEVYCDNNCKFQFNISSFDCGEIGNYEIHRNVPNGKKIKSGVWRNDEEIYINDIDCLSLIVVAYSDECLYNYFLVNKKINVFSIEKKSEKFINVKIIDEDTQEPIEGAMLRVGSGYVGIERTDKNGIAKINASVFENNVGIMFSKIDYSPLVVFCGFDGECLDNDEMLIGMKKTKKIEVSCIENNLSCPQEVNIYVDNYKYNKKYKNNIRSQRYPCWYQSPGKWLCDALDGDAVFANNNGFVKEIKIYENDKNIIIFNTKTYKVCLQFDSESSCYLRSDTFENIEINNGECTEVEYDGPIETIQGLVNCGDKFYHGNIEVHSSEDTSFQTIDLIPGGMVCLEDVDNCFFTSKLDFMSIYKSTMDCTEFMYPATYEYTCSSGKSGTVDVESNAVSYIDSN